jgi:cytochrome c biogenesis protein
MVAHHFSRVVMTQTSSQVALTPPLRRVAFSDLIELLASMRFSISLLTIICVASVVGTVLPQNRSENSYIDQFGPFWFDVLDKFSVWSIYNNWWFLLIMAFLVVSTSLCLMRNAPKMLKDMRSYRESVRGSSLRAFHHRVEVDTQRDLTSSTQAISAWLAKQGYGFKKRQEENGVLIAAKKGSANRLGYIAAHASIVIICIGGLLDSELPVRFQVWLFDKKPLLENMLIADVPPSGRLSIHNPSFRSNVLIPEGATRGNAIVNVGQGAMVQPLPFELTLKKFIVDYYSTGMPSRFASDVEVTDPDTGEKFDVTIEVNEPLRYKGVTVYQSSFDDGGSELVLQGYPLQGPRVEPVSMTKQVGESVELTLGQNNRKVQLEVTGLRPINVEDLSAGDPQPQLLREHVAAVTGSAASKKTTELRNIGPSVEYKIIDESGQATLFHNYMLPVELDGARVLLAGVEDPKQGGAFRYMRIPVDEQSGPLEFMELRAALADPTLRKAAARQFAINNASTSVDQQALQLSAERTLDTFAQSGLQGVSAFLEKNVPQAELPRAADVVVRVLGASLAELRALSRVQSGRAMFDPLDAQQGQWTQLAVAALSDLALYPAPILFTLQTFNHVQASVFQVSRAPGMLIVYIGCVLLIIGVFSMFYVRDRRIWVWLRHPPGENQTHVLAAMTSQKRTLDFNREFEKFQQAMRRLDAKKESS